MILNIHEGAFHEQVKKNLKAAHTPLYGAQLDAEAQKTIDEYNLNIKGVRDSLKGFVYEYGEYDPYKKSHNDVYYDLSQVLGLRYLKGQPRLVPQIIILGPPGSGRGTQAKTIAKKYGLVHISTRALVKEELARKPAIATVMSECMNEGKMIPESIITPLIVKRL